MSQRPRVLVLESAAGTVGNMLRQGRPEWDVVSVHDLPQGLAELRNNHFDALYAESQERSIHERICHLLQAESVLEALDEGVALVDAQLRVTWSNARFLAWCGGSAVGRSFYDALGSPETLGPDYSPFYTALAGQAATTRLHCCDNRYLELRVTPVHDGQQRITQLISVTRDVTAEVQQQQKLDALHQAGRELSALSPDELAEMSVEERIELLKSNIRRFIHDLLHYDVIEIRLLDRTTGKLEPLLSEGMTPEASRRVLYARAEGNGVTGFVAATGKSYLCPDTAVDPLYIEGAPGARSSLTVPIMYQDQVIGTFNVESPQAEAFDQTDLQFAEIFSREIATALHTLELLTAEKRSSVSQSVEAVRREVVMPVDDILAAATTLLDRYIGHDAELTEKLRQILASARSIKQCIQKVGEDLTPTRSAGPDHQAHPQLRGMRILVADSDERVRRSAHSLLGRFGCIVETARDGREALTMARLGSYDAILTDIRHPDLTGYEVFRQLRDVQPHAKVIFMTGFGYDPNHSIVKARQEGLQFVLYKPFRIDQLLDALEAPSTAVTS
ncbi:MAG: response regulator [Gemmataceae bacterium]|nr:response regulator [Gemmataceae bacterium]MDW8266460.1 response regulator [Gemmataceae bacterium]